MTRQEFLKLTKTANPELNIPEVDIPFKMQGMMEAEAKKREELENKIREGEIRQQVKDRREAMIKTKGLSESQVQEVEKMMVDKGIMNHDTAADFYLSQQQSAPPTPSQFTGSQQVPKVDLKNFGGNIAQWARSEANTMIGDIRSGRIKV